MTREMYSKITTFVLVAAIAAVLITSVTLAMTDDADAKKKKKRSGGFSQSSSQSNNCDFPQCQNAGSEIQGDGNAVSISQNQD
jgi:hypothetical protein